MINFKKKKTSMLVVFLLITSCSVNQIDETPSIQKNKEKSNLEIPKVQKSVIPTPEPVISNIKESPSPVLVNNNISGNNNNPNKVLSINYMPKTINLDVGKSTTIKANIILANNCLLYTSPSPRD